MKFRLLKVCLLIIMLLAFASCSSAPKNYGIKPIEPENGEETKNLQPILKWSKAEDHDGTYDLVIFEEINDDKTDKKLRLQEIYFRKGLPGGDNPQHQLEISLNPEKDYRWTVRPRNGQSIGAWAAMETNLFTGVSYHRRVKPFYFYTPEDYDG